MYDYGRKVFAFKNSPDILGYCGDVLFPSMVLSQIVEMADSGLLFSAKAPCNAKFNAIRQKLKYQFASYPHEVESITSDTLEILHASRDPTNNKLFQCNLLRWTRSSGWTDIAVDLPPNSGPLFVRGQGGPEFTENFEKYRGGPNARTSRSVFHCFCDSLFNTKIPTVGGAPQLAGVIRKPDSGGIYYGVMANGRRYHLGTRIDELENFDRLVWRNELFEICDGRTGKRKVDAQPQPNPHRH
jgi:hypothetical protein